MNSMCFLPHCFDLKTWTRLMTNASPNLGKSDCNQQIHIHLLNLSDSPPGGTSAPDCQKKQGVSVNDATFHWPLETVSFLPRVAQF